MKNKINFFGIIAIVAVIVFTMAACDFADEDDTDEDDTVETPEATLTITGLGNYVGNYIFARMGGDKDNIVATADIGTESNYGQGYPAIGGLIEKGSITLPVWEMTSETEDNFAFTHEKAPYTGNDTLTLYIEIWENGPGIFTGLTHQYAGVEFCVVTATFNNGSANVAFVPYVYEEEE